MCELLGLSFARPVAASFSIRLFGARDADNADGWGLGWYRDGSLSLAKEPVSWRSSRFASFLEGYDALASSLYVAHVRRRTVGRALTHANTHPFSRELFGRSYCFAHNGTLKGFEALALGHHQPLGQTDSEHAFCHLLLRLGERGHGLDGERDWHWLAERFAELNELGTLNCLLADGRHLFVYFCRTAYKGLWMRHLALREQEPRRLGDRETELAVEGSDDTPGIVVATRPLDDLGWHRVLPGELLVLRDGRLLHSTHRGTRRARPPGSPVG